MVECPDGPRRILCRHHGTWQSRERALPPVRVVSRQRDGLCHRCLPATSCGWQHLCRCRPSARLRQCRRIGHAEVTQVSIQLSGVVQDSIALLLSNNYIDRRVVIYKGFYKRGRVVVDPISIFDGRADSPVIEEDPGSGKCTVTLSAAQHWIDFERLPGRHTNDAEEQIFFPGDKASSLSQVSTRRSSGARHER